MHFRPWTAAAALLVFAVSAAAAAFAAEDDQVCTGSKPFREVAQDEIYTMAELCMMREDSLRGDRGWTPPDAADPAPARDLEPADASRRAALQPRPWR